MRSRVRAVQQPRHHQKADEDSGIDAQDRQVIAGVGTSAYPFPVNDSSRFGQHRHAVRRDAAAVIEEVGTVPVGSIDNPVVIGPCVRPLSRPEPRLVGLQTGQQAIAPRLSR